VKSPRFRRRPFSWLRDIFAFLERSSLSVPDRNGQWSDALSLCEPSSASLQGAMEAARATPQIPIDSATDGGPSGHFVARQFA
jgi:hypothetical protein